MFSWQLCSTSVGSGCDTFSDDEIYTYAEVVVNCIQIYWNDGE